MPVVFTSVPLRHLQGMRAARGRQRKAVTITKWRKERKRKEKRLKIGREWGGTDTVQAMYELNKLV